MHVCNHLWQLIDNVKMLRSGDTYLLDCDFHPKVRKLEVSSK